MMWCDVELNVALNVTVGLLVRLRTGSVCFFLLLFSTLG